MQRPAEVHQSIRERGHEGGELEEAHVWDERFCSGWVTEEQWVLHDIKLWIWSAESPLLSLNTPHFKH